MTKPTQNTNVDGYLLNSYNCIFSLLSPLLGPCGPSIWLGHSDQNWTSFLRQIVLAMLLVMFHYIMLHV